MAATKTSSGQQAIAGVGVGGSVGANVASAATVTLYEFVTEITGSTTINTLSGMVSGRVYIVIPATGATWKFGGTGNIEHAFTPTVGVPVLLVMHGSAVRVVSAGASGSMLPVADVRDFGAVLDGTTDDGAALNLAMAALPNGGTLLVPGHLKTTLLHTISTPFLTLDGGGRRAATIESSNATGAILITANFVSIRNIGVKYTASGAYGVKIDNGTTNPSTGVFEPVLRDMKIWGTHASGSHGLWLVNSFRGIFNGIALPSGGGEAVRLEASSFHEFTSIKASVNDGEGGPTWAKAFTLQKQTGNDIHQSDSNTFTLCLGEGVGTGLLITSTLSGGTPPARNCFVNCTFEGNADYDIRITNGHSNKFFGGHNESDPTATILVETTGSHNNAFYGVTGAATITNPGIAQGIQHTKFFDHNGTIIIGGANVYGTVVMGSTGAVTDDGTESWIQEGILAASPNATTKFSVPTIALGTAKYQTFTLQLKNNAGTLQHRIVADSGNIVIPIFADKINAAAATFANTPTVAAGVAFTNGVGVLSGSTSLVLFDTIAQVGGAFGTAEIEYNDSTAAVMVRITNATAQNVNGVTHIRTTLTFSNPTTGAAVPITTATIGSGLQIMVRLAAWIQ